MRKIKFRAFHKLSKKWRAHEEALSVLMLQGRVADGTADDKDDFLNQIVVEQYTGLKDKNGVEIFEGDILKVYNWSMFDGELLGKGSVFFCEDHGHWQTEPMIIEDQYDFYKKAVFEVIGNIHEV